MTEDYLCPSLKTIKINSMKKLVLLAASALMLNTNVSLAQSIKMPTASPTQTVTQAFGLGEIGLSYSRPLARGRVIFGDNAVVPYGNIWRTGANGTTKISFTDDVTFQGIAVKAGTYGLYTIPGKTEWQLMLTSDLKLAGNVAEYDKSKEVLRVTVKPVEIASMIENFTINIDGITATEATLELMWEHTIVSIRITTDIDSRVMKDINSAMNNDNRPYFQSASYYYDNNKDMNQALTWVNKAIEQNPAFYVLHLKAKIQMKLKDYKGAIATAEESKAAATKAKNQDYVRMNNKLIARAKKK